MMRSYCSIIGAISFSLFLGIGCETRGIGESLVVQSNCLMIASGAETIALVQVLDSSGTGVNKIPVTWQLFPPDVGVRIREQEDTTATREHGNIHMLGVARAFLSADEELEEPRELWLVVSSSPGALLDASILVKAGPDLASEACDEEADAGVDAADTGILEIHPNSNSPDI